MERSRTPRASTPKVCPASPHSTGGYLHPMDRARYSAPNLCKVTTPHGQRQPSFTQSHSAVYFANPYTNHEIPPMPPLPQCPLESYHHCQSHQPSPCATRTVTTPDIIQLHQNCGTQSGRLSHQTLPGSYPEHTPHSLRQSSSVVYPAPSHQPSPSPFGFLHPSRLAFWGNARRTKKVELYKGNLVLDCPVPTQLLEMSARKDKEFRQMRYSAVTCDPDDFASNKYTLRSRLMNRQTELFVVMTMYNEDEVLFCRTMHGVMKNIAHLCARQRSRVWDAEGWKKVVVCIVADGRKKCDQRVLDVLTTMGVYQKGIAKNMVDDKPVQAHLFEYTTQVSVDSDMQIKGAEKGIVPVQILFCLKEKNSKKINSHRWFFNAFGPVLQPSICVLLDVGTRPGNTSIYHLWKAFNTNRNVGGACGEVCVMKGTAGLHLLNPLVAAQNFEYKMSNILDKPLESVFGYISVLPGAFSAYRYAALQNDCNGTGPLQKYFLGETRDDSGESNIFTANMYLAEDRILCFELLAKKHQKWVLKYVQPAFGETDCPDQLPEFISQRRRWLNGSFFAAVYSLCHFSRIWSTQHSAGRKIMLTIEFIFNFFNLIFNWLGMANFYLTFYFVTKSLADPSVDPFGNGWGNRVFQILRYLYIFLFIVSFICSMGNRPQGSKWMFVVSVVLYGVIMGYTMFAGGWLSYQAVLRCMEAEGWSSDRPMANMIFLMGLPAFRNVVVSVTSSYGLYLISSLLYLDPWHMITSFTQYLMLLPTYVNVLNVYAFCNTHDVSWGTKGDNTVPMDLGVASKVSSDEKGVDAVELELVDGLDPVNRYYGEAIQNLQNKPDNVRESRPPQTKQDDYYRGFRTRLVLAWIGCNAMLVVFVTSGDFRSLIPQAMLEQSSERSQDTMGVVYTGCILWMIAGTACFRFFGSALYLLHRCFRL